MRRVRVTLSLIALLTRVLFCATPAHAETSKLFGVWNGFNAHTNILECSNLQTSSLRVVLDIKANSGASLAKQVIHFAPNETKHLVLNSFNIMDTFGVYVLASKSDLRTALNCSTLFYRFNGPNAEKDVDYAFAIPAQSGQSGITAGIYNSMNPEGSGTPVYNWLSIYNPTDQRFSATVKVYDQDGNYDSARSKHLKNLAPWGRYDLPLGHDVGEKVGLYRIVPDNSAQIYGAFLTRYSQRADGTFDFSFPLLSSSGFCDSGAISASSMGRAMNWGEIANPGAQALGVKLEVFSAMGKLLSAGTIKLPPFAQRHIFLNAIIGNNDVGFFRVRCVQPNSTRTFLAESLFYGQKANNAQQVEWAYASQAQGSFPNEEASLVAPFNTFLGAYNWLKFFNPALTSIPSKTTMLASAATVQARAKVQSLDLQGSYDLGVNSQVGSDAYGMARTEVTSGSVTSELIRVLPKKDGSIGYIFSIPSKHIPKEKKGSSSSSSSSGQSSSSSTSGSTSSSSTTTTSSSASSSSSTSSSASTTTTTSTSSTSSSTSTVRTTTTSSSSSSTSTTVKTTTTSSTSSTLRTTTTTSSTTTTTLGGPKSGAKVLGNNQIGTGTDEYDRNNINAFRVQMPGTENGSLSTMSVYVAAPVAASPNNQAQLAVYADNNGAPGALVASSVSFAITGNSWNTVSLQGNLIAGQVYWLGYNTNAVNGSDNNLKISSGTLNSEHQWHSQVFGTWPNPYGSSSGQGSGLASLYLTYDPTAPTGTTTTTTTTTTSSTSSTLVGATTTTTLPPSGVRPVPLADLSAPSMGVNLDGAVDYNHSKFFVDLAKLGYFYEVSDWRSGQEVKTQVQFGSDGWPVSDFSIYLARDDGDSDYGAKPLNQGGTYTLIFNGQALLGGSNFGPVTYDAAKNETRVTATVSDGNREIRLSFLDTKRTATSALHSGVTGIRFIRAGYPVDNPPTFTTEFLNAIAPFSTLRFMDLLNTNNADDDDINWSDRVTPNSAVQTDKSRTEKIAYEYAIDMGNVSGKDIWLNVPDMANDDYFDQLAHLVRDRLTNPNVHVYLEWSNEVWNGQFPQHQRNLDAAQSDPDVLLPGETSEDYYVRSFRRVGVKIYKLSEAFRRAYAEIGQTNVINTKIRPILADQIGWVDHMATILNFLHRKYGPPRNYLYAIAGAPYFGGDSFATADDFFTTANANLDWYMKNDGLTDRNAYSDYYTIGQAYGLGFVSYEGGIDTVDRPVATKNKLDVKIAVNADQRMLELSRKYLGGWYGCGGNLFMYFRMSDGYNMYGQWGMTQFVNEQSLRRQAAVDSINSPMSQFDCGISTYKTTTGTAGTGSGLTGTYYKGTTFSGTPFVTRIDPVVNFHWQLYDTGIPAPELITTYPFWSLPDFSVRWTGKIVPRFGGELYTLSLPANDGVRLYIDGQLRINDWTGVTNMTTKERSAQLVLSSGPHDITIEYYNVDNDGTVRLYWQSPSQPKAVVSRSYLYPQ